MRFIQCAVNSPQPFHRPSALTSRERTRSLLLPTRMMGVWGCVSRRRRRSWAVRWKLRLSVTENTSTHTSHCSVDKSCGKDNTQREERTWPRKLDFQECQLCHFTVMPIVPTAEAQEIQMIIE